MKVQKDGKIYYDEYYFEVVKNEKYYYDVWISSDKNEIKVGETLQLRAEKVLGTTAPNDITTDNKTSWISENTDIAEIDNNGLVTGKSEGETTIKVRYDMEDGDFLEDSYDITVIKGEENKLTSTEYVIDEENNFIKNIKPKTSINSFKNKLNINDCEIYSEGIIEEGIISTGMNAKFKNIDKIYKLAVIGDIVKNGEMDITDLSRLIRHCINIEKYVINEDIELISADVNSDGNVNQIDITKMIRYILNEG